MVQLTIVSRRSEQHQFDLHWRTNDDDENSSASFNEGTHTINWQYRRQGWETLFWKIKLTSATVAAGGLLSTHALEMSLQMRDKLSYSTLALL